MTAATVILDTNVFVGAGFNPHSASARLIAAIGAGELILVWHATTLAETRRIVEKIPRLDFGAFEPLFAPPGEYENALNLQAAEAVPDPEDRKFAALAMQSGAPLVSSDDDLLSVRDALAADIWTPGEAAARLSL